MFLHPAPVSTGPCVRATRRVAPALVALALLFLPSVARADITTGLKGYWKFDEGAGATTADSTGNGSTGTLAGGPGWVAGVAGGALSFNGSAYVNLAAPTTALQNVLNGGFTLSCWVKLNAYDQFNGIMFFNSIGLTQGKNQAFELIGYSDNNMANTAVNSIVPGTWQHVVGTFDGTTYNIYLNGVKSVAPFVSDNGYAQGGKYRFMIGYGDTPSNGSLDEVRIYDRALSASDVAELYGASDPNGGLVARWTFDEGAGMTVKDTAGNNTGTLVSGPAFVPGKSGTALSFGGSAYVNIAAPTTAVQNVFNGAFTLSCWVKLNAYDEYYGLVFLNSIGLTQGHNQAFELIGYSNNNMVNTAVNSIVPGTWQHVVGTFDGTTYNIYLNGVKSVAPFKTDAGYAQGGKYRFMVGYGDTPSNGTLDDVRVYNRALSDTEVLALYHSGFSVAPTSRGFSIIKGISKIQF